MGQFTLTMSCDNAAFEDAGVALEIARCLRDLAERMTTSLVSETFLLSGQEMFILDHNGNRVGEAQYTA